MVPSTDQVYEGQAEKEAIPPTSQPGTQQQIETKSEHGAVAKIMAAPASGGSLAGAAVLGAAVLFGTMEAAVGAGAAYVVYRILRKRRDARAAAPSEART